MGRMDTKVHRRQFLKITAAASALPLTQQLVGAAAAKAPAARPAAEDTGGLTAYELGPQIWIRYHNRQLTCYRAHRSQKYTYLFPLTGPASGCL